MLFPSQREDSVQLMLPFVANKGADMLQEIRIRSNSLGSCVNVTNLLKHG